jgi:DNA invertase Pin-like site-specific DNA recombinase
MRENGVMVDKRAARLVGYARVSTIEQNLDMQVEALLKAGVDKRHLHVEKISASAKRRPIFAWALQSLRPGDVFVVWKLDRLGRDVRAIHKTLDIIRDYGASVRSLTEQIDTDTPIGGFTLNLMASLAQQERDQVIMRTRAGVDAARRRGVKFGQPPKLDAKQRQQCRAWKRQGLTVREIVARVKSEYKITVSHGAVQNYVTKRK